MQHSYLAKAKRCKLIASTLTNIYYGLKNDQPPLAVENFDGALTTLIKEFGLNRFQDSQNPAVLRWKRFVIALRIEFPI